MFFTTQVCAASSIGLCACYAQPNFDPPQHRETGLSVSSRAEASCLVEFSSPILASCMDFLRQQRLDNAPQDNVPIKQAVFNPECVKEWYFTFATEPGLEWATL